MSKQDLPNSADLQLAVRAAGELDDAGRALPHPITGAVAPRAGGARHERGGRLARLAAVSEVSAGKAGASTRRSTSTDPRHSRTGPSTVHRSASSTEAVRSRMMPTPMSQSNPIRSCRPDRTWPRHSDVFGQPATTLAVAGPRGCTAHEGVSPTATVPGPPPPDPRNARTITGLVTCLRATKAWTGDASVRELTRRINTDRRRRSSASRDVVPSTVGYSFDLRRQRLDYDLVFELLRAMGLTEPHLQWWRQAWQSVFARYETPTAVTTSTALPDDLPWFRGRAAELDQLLNAARGPAGATSGVVSVIEGMAGVGKTALAVHAAHRLDHPDQVRLYVNLRGFDPGQPAADPGAVLESFLRVLGITGGGVPRGVPARARLYRSVLRCRRALIVLDNAADVGQVRPLLPDGPEHRVLVTSRHTLGDLGGAQRLSLDVFTPDEAVQLLRAMIGSRRVDAEPDAARRIATRYGRLPLALSLISRHIRSTPDWQLADHAERLRGLGLADGVQAALTLSYRQLDAGDRRMFRLVGVNPSPDLTVHAAAALADLDARQAQRHLDTLVAEHLLHCADGGRYHAHDLVLAYAAHRARDEEPASRRRQAVTRLLDHYLNSAALAMDAAHPAERSRRPRIDQASPWSPPLPDLATARAWLDAERPNLIAAIVHAAAHGWSQHAGQLTATIWRHLDTSGRYGDILAIHRHALSAARQLDDRTAEALVRHNLGTVHWRLGRKIEAIDHFENALELRRQTGDRPAQAQTLNNLSVVVHALGRHQDALRLYQETLALFREVGDRLGEAGALNNLGVVLEHLRRLDDAARREREALALFREIGSKVGEADALANLCVVHRRQGRHDAAIAHQQQALDIFRAIGDRGGEAGGLINLGDIRQQQDRHGEAAQLYRQALAIANDLGDPELKAEALNSFGLTLRATGRFDEAIEHHTRALALARQIHDKTEQTRALEGLAQAAHAAGRPALAAKMRLRAETVGRVPGSP